MKTWTVLGTLLFAQTALVSCAAQVSDEGDVDDGDVALEGQALTPESGRVPLVTFFSPSRGDYFSTTDPTWTCSVLGSCARQLDYQVIGIAGYVVSPDRPRPSGGLPLFHWWSAARGDNFLTTDPAWSGEIGAIHSGDDGYRLFRIEGWIPMTRSEEGAVPLDSFWNSGVADNAAVNSVRVKLGASWTWFRTEGFLLAPNAAGGRKCRARFRPTREETAWHAPGNFDNTWPGSSRLFDGDSLQISASGSTSIDFWGTSKNVAGEGPAGGDYLAPGEPAWSLVGRVTSGRMWVPGRGSYAANVWFPIGASTGCLEYDSQGTSRGTLVVSINDNNRSDNSGGPSVSVNQYF